MLTMQSTMCKGYSISCKNCVCSNCCTNACNNKVKAIFLILVLSYITSTITSLPVSMITRMHSGVSFLLIPRCQMENARVLLLCLTIYH